MSAKVVNLRLARKRKARAEKVRAATENAAQHGEAKAELELRHARKALETRDLDGKKRE